MFEWISRQSIFAVYSFLFFNALVESIFPPYPSDAFILVFAFLAGRGHYSPYGVAALTVMGSITGIMLIYRVGRWRGNALLAFLSGSFLGRLFPVPLIERAKAKFRERGDLIVILNRFLPGMRAPICFAAGMVGIAPRKVFIYSLISVVAWNAFLVTAGFYVGATWDEASAFLRDYTLAATLCVIGLLILLSVVYFRKRSR
jgi:membrane protein DedA with SNARE-associated domain